jgi:hypothetical protein
MAVSITKINEIITNYCPNITIEDIGDISYLLGKNRESNWKIYQESSQKNTIFHLDKFPSAYVIASVPIESLTKSQIMIGANLCKANTKYRNVPKIGVMYTSISNTRLGSEVGSFIINNRGKCHIIYT